MTDTRADQLKRQIDSKQGFIRYLENRLNDPAPIHAEIARHRAAIAKHEDSIANLDDLLHNGPGRLAAAHSELKSLQIEYKGAKPVTTDDLQAKVARLEAQLAVLNGGAK